MSLQRMDLGALEDSTRSDKEALDILDTPRAVGRYEDVDHPIEVLLTEPVIAGRLEELDRTKPAGVIKSLDLLEVQGMIKAAASERFITSSESSALMSRLNSVTEKADEGRVRILSIAFVEYAVSIYTMVYTAAVEPPREWQSLAKKIDTAHQKRAITDGEYKQLVELLQTYEQEIVNAKRHKLFSLQDNLEICNAKRTVTWRSALIEESKRIAAMHLERPSNIQRAFLYKLDCAHSEDIIDDNDYMRLLDRVRTAAYKTYRTQIDDYVEANDGLTAKKRDSLKAKIDADYSVNQLTKDEYVLLCRHLNEQPIVRKKREQTTPAPYATPPVALHSRVSSRYQVLATWINVMRDNGMLDNEYLSSAINSAIGDASSRGEISTFEESNLKEAVYRRDRVLR